MCVLKGKNPCQLGTHDCSENARCIYYSNDTYTCQCLEGFKDYKSLPGRDCRSKYLKQKF